MTSKYELWAYMTKGRRRFENGTGCRGIVYALWGHDLQDCHVVWKFCAVLYLRYYEEYQVKEIAGVLGVTPNLVSARLLRAKRLLRQAFFKQNQNQEKEAFRDETGNI